DFIMADNIMSKAATMEIPINSNGDTGTLTEDDSLEQDLQQVMVSGPNLNETSIVSGGYGGPAGGIIPTSSIKGIVSRSYCHSQHALMSFLQSEHSRLF
ncbi:Arfaptin-2, partial [Goodea atripinnis]